MRCGSFRAFGMTTGFHHNNRFHAGSGSGCGHEFSGICNCFNIQENCFCLRIIGKIIQHIPEIYVAHITQRYKMRKSDTAIGCPIQYRRNDCAGLGGKGKSSGQCLNMSKTCVEKNARNHQPQTVGTYNPQQIRTRCIQHLLAKAMPMLTAALSETGGNHDCGSGSFFAQLSNQSRHSIRGRDNHRQIRGDRKTCNIRICPDSFNGLIFGIDRKNFSGKSRIDNIPHNNRAYRAGFVACTD